MDIKGFCSLVITSFIYVMMMMIEQELGYMNVIWQKSFFLTHMKYIAL
jgi:hypothetical protein